MKEAARLAGFTLVVALAFFLGCRHGRRTAANGPLTDFPRDTVKVVRHDTVRVSTPVYLSKETIRHDTVHFTTIRRDTVEVAVPIERKVYAEDSLYRAVVTGYRASLDTLIVWPRTTTITVTNRVEVPGKVPRWSLGVTAGPSVLATPSGSVHAGLGVTAGVSWRF